MFNMVNTYALNNEKIDMTQAKIWTAQVVILKAETKSKDFAKFPAIYKATFIENTNDSKSSKSRSLQNSLVTLV